MNELIWSVIESREDLETIDNASIESPQYIYKHSTRCGISSAIKSRINKEAQAMEHPPRIYYLDLLAHRDLSDSISNKYHIRHESPQLLVIHEKKCIWHASHFDISLSRIDALQQN